MRNYIEINGVSSLTLVGFAINTLPPISKPPMRNLIEEIDGRDGDIITKLGYGAYDKQIEVGIYGESYDINKIIAFFNSEGEIVFSNEDDKIYNFTILEQIDFEKLVKFKTAVITLHCQPFKYKKNEEPIEIEYEYVNGSGISMTLNNTDEKPFTKFDLKGNTSQTGTPTPTSPIPVNVVSGDNEINVVGKNLFNKDSVVGGFVNADGTIGGDTSAYRTSDFIPIQPNTSYYKTLTESPRTKYYDSNKLPLNTTTYQDISIGGNAGTFTTPNNACYLRFSYPVASVDANNIMVHKGTTSSTYEPYIGNTYNIDLPSGMELCKIGTYQDYIYKDSDKWYLHKEIGKVVLDGSESWIAETQRYRVDNIIQGKTFTSFDGNNPLAYCEGFKWGNGTSSIFVNGAFWYTSNGLNLSLQKDENPNATTLANFKTWLGSNNQNVRYVLATPTTTQITDTTLISQLEALEQAQSKNGETNISQINNDLPFILDVEAFKLGSDIATITNGGNIFSKPILELSGSGTIGVSLNDNQLFNVDLSDPNAIIIDPNKLEAYNPSTLNLMNRKVIGDIENLKLPVGENTLKVSGSLTKATITKYERWL